MNRLRRGREICGLSIAQAAKLLGWSQGPLHAMEIGATKPTDTDLGQLAKLYQTSPEWLLGAEPVLPDQLHQMLRDAADDGVSAHDRDIVLEVSGMWAKEFR